jgi:RecA-family ATPase
MSLSLDRITETLQAKGENLNKEDVENIRSLYVDLDLDEQNIINDVEEIISQIEITPQNQDL